MSFFKSIFVAILDLFRDKDSQNKLSKGAILLWITFGFLCFFWVKYALMLDPKQPIPNVIPDAPESLMAIFITLLLYIVFPKRCDLSSLLLGLFNKKSKEMTSETKTNKHNGIDANNGDGNKPS